MGFSVIYGHFFHLIQSELQIFVLYNKVIFFLKWCKSVFKDIFLA